CQKVLEGKVMVLQEELSNLATKWIEYLNSLKNIIITQNQNDTLIEYIDKKLPGLYLKLLNWIDCVNLIETCEYQVIELKKKIIEVEKLKTDILNNINLAKRKRFIRRITTRKSETTKCQEIVVSEENKPHQNLTICTTPVENLKNIGKDKIRLEWISFIIVR
ncbi:unnamed protein product, partial [Meganyctiphanes norvegica]